MRRLRPWLATLVSAALAAVVPLQSSVPLEYEATLDDGWRWFSLPTNDAAGVAAGLVLQRGYSQNFPRIGFVAMASSSGVPPGSLSGASYNPTTYTQHDDPVGPRRAFFWDSPTDGVRSDADWKVLTIGIDTNRSVDDPQSVFVPLGTVLIGVRCNENLWSGTIPGCRYSLTATLLPFELQNGQVIRAPMARADTHVFRVTAGEYDTIQLTCAIAPAPPAAPPPPPPPPRPRPPHPAPFAASARA